MGSSGCLRTALSRRLHAPNVFDLGDSRDALRSAGRPPSAWGRPTTAAPTVPFHGLKISRCSGGSTIAIHLLRRAGRLWDHMEQLGPYRIVESLAEGSAANVYAAVRRGVAGFAQHVAIKVLRDEVAG